MRPVYQETVSAQLRTIPCKANNIDSIKRFKKEREFDPEVVKAVEAKLRALSVDLDDPATSATEVG